jgi:hypothetical protein
MSWWRRLLAGGDAAAPAGFDGALDADERLLGSAPTADGHLVASTRGLWVPEPGGNRRIGWHLVSKATWDGRALTVTEAEEVGPGEHGAAAVVIADLPPRRFVLAQPGPVPQLVQARVTRSVLHSERTAGGDLVVHRRVPGRDGVLTQLRRASG